MFFIPCAQRGLALAEGSLYHGSMERPLTPAPDPRDYGLYPGALTKEWRTLAPPGYLKARPALGAYLALPMRQQAFPHLQKLAIHEAVKERYPSLTSSLNEVWYTQSLWETFCRVREGDLETMISEVHHNLHFSHDMGLQEADEVVAALDPLVKALGLSSLRMGTPPGFLSYYTRHPSFPEFLEECLALVGSQDTPRPGAALLTWALQSTPSGPLGCSRLSFAPWDLLAECGRPLDERLILMGLMQRGVVSLAPLRNLMRAPEYEGFPLEILLPLASPLAEACAALPLDALPPL